MRLVLALLLCPAYLLAQGTDLGTIRGTVTDATGAVVPNTKVTITDVGTNMDRTYVTNAEGVYEASALRSGSYKISVSSTGFNTTELTGIRLRAGETARVDIKLEIARANESVVVRSEAPVVQTDNPTIINTLDNRLVTELPRDSRDYQSFLYLNPNITRGAAEGSFKFLGAQSYGASFSLDGQRSNGGVFGEPTASQPSLEAIGELTVLTNSFTAEYAGIANVRVSSRRGGSAYNGSLFYNNRNSALAAWDLRDKLAQAAFRPSPAQPNFREPYFNLNEFGGSFGGPLKLIPKVFFFGAYERRIENRPVNFRSTTLPHASLYSGDFSRLNDNNKPVVPAAVLAQLTPEEIAQNTVGGLGQRFIRIPSRLVNPFTKAIVDKYYPQTSTALGINPANGRLIDYFNSIPGRVRRHLGTIRMDYEMSESDRLFGVFNIQDNTQTSALVVPPFESLGPVLNERQNYTLSLGWTHMFSNSVINELRGGFNSQPNFRRSSTTLTQFLQNIGFSEADIRAYGDAVTPSVLDTYGHPAISIANFQSIGSGGRNTYRPLDQDLMTFGNTLNWIRGRHTIKIGADIVRNSAVDGFTSGRSDPRGVISYTGTGPDAWSRFLMGLPANNVQFVNQFRPPMDVHNWETGFFLQDDFKVTPRLTLNLGLRYELITNFIENNNLLVNLDPDYVGQNGRRGRFVVPTQETLKYLDPRWVAYGTVTADELGLPRSLVNNDYNNFAPRLGAAYRVTDRTVLRGGYGWFYPTSAAQGIRDPLATNSFQVRLRRNNTVDVPLSAWPRPMTGGVQPTLSGQPGGNWVPFDLKQPRIQQYNISFERDLGWSSGIRVSYLGSRMSGLISGRDYNMLAPNDRPWGTTIGDGVTPCVPDNFDCDVSAADRARLPYPEFGAYLIGFGNMGKGRSHAFQTEFNRRGALLHINASYTLLDQKSTAPDVGASSLGGTTYNQFNPESDYGEDAFTSRHRLVTYGIVETPFGRGRKYGSQIPRWLDAVAGGWGFTWQGFAKSGYGFTPFWTCGNCDIALPGNIAAGSIDPTGSFNYGPAFRPVVVGDGMQGSGDRIFNPDAFAAPPMGADLFSNSSVAVRHLLRGPGTWGLNGGFRKYFRIGEGIRAELGADVNNLFNHPLRAPDNYELGNLGIMYLRVNPASLQPEVDRLERNPDFGRLITSYPQEGVDSRRMIRLRLRITF
jgi:hypothetical protein